MANLILDYKGHFMYPIIMASLSMLEMLHKYITIPIIDSLNSASYSDLYIQGATGALFLFFQLGSSQHCLVSQ